MKTQVTPFRIYDFLDLDHRIWHVEFEINDFKGETIAQLLELPLAVYNTNPKANFWAFLKIFLQECELSLIKRRYPTGIGIRRENNEIALLGHWENQEMAIPLWILDDLLLGFEIVSQKEYSVLNSQPLNWVYALSNEQISFIAGNGVVSISDDVFRDQKIFFELKKVFISLSAFNEEEFFTRIANTDISETEDFGDALEF